jgi:pyruvate dehydrogenase complex dehydrogenase (E1) component
MITTKVQKKSKHIAISMLQNEKFKKGIIQILEDDTIFFKIEDTFFNMFNIYDEAGEDPDWKPANKHHGYSSIFLLLGIQDEHELIERLGDYV